MKQILIITVLISLIACKGGDKKETATDEKVAASTETPSTNSSTNKADDIKDGIVSFKVNDTLAQTRKKGKDTDTHIGLYTEASKYLNLGLEGDVPNRPHRGSLLISIANDFKFEPGTFTLGKNVYATYSRYETENAGGETSFEASADERYNGTSLTVAFTKIDKVPNEIGGTDHRVSGTFNVKLFNKVYELKRKGTPEEINITEGTFENIRLAGGPK
jgi:hypothetical protein